MRTILRVVFTLPLFISFGLARADPPSALQTPQAPVPGATAPENGLREPELPRDPWRPREPVQVAGAIPHCGPWVRDGFESIQVNNDGYGCNLTGDAANEPSIAIDPTDPRRVVIGWRQFDSVLSDFRQAGFAYSQDSGLTWTYPGLTLEPGVFGSDPVLAADSDGAFYYLSLQPTRGPSEWACYMYKSFDGGLTWPQEVYAYGGDKAWFTIDTTGGLGDGNLYAFWSQGLSCCADRNFTRSTLRGVSFDAPQLILGNPTRGTVAVGPEGEVYVAGVPPVIRRSLNAEDPDVPPSFQPLPDANLGVLAGPGALGPNPGGLFGQTWVACDHSPGTFRGFVYLFGTVGASRAGDSLDAMFARSSKSGQRWSPPRRVNDDADDADAVQWFGTMSVAPNGRIDVVWNDTRNGPNVHHSELFHSSSVDAGRTWSRNVAVSPMFDSWLGWPQQNKIGDYYHSISDRDGVNVAYSATFNGEQDVYFLRIPADCDADGVSDAAAIADGRAMDINTNAIPDGCETDTDGDGLLDMSDSDMDGDGVANTSDACPLGPFGFRCGSNGGPFGDGDGDCRVDLVDHHWWTTVFDCFETSGPDSISPGRRCRDGLDFDADGDVDLADISMYQRIFGLYGG